MTEGKEANMTIPVNIKNKKSTLNIGGRTITLNENETIEQAIASIRNPQANGGGGKVRGKKEDPLNPTEETK